MVKFPPGGLFSGLPRLGNNQLLALWSPWTRVEPFPGHCESCSSSFDFLDFIPRGERGLDFLQTLKSSFPFLLALGKHKEHKSPSWL